MAPAFLCLVCETARTIDPFTRRGNWSNRTLRLWLTVETWIILALILIGSDISAWLNYHAVKSLLLKPQRRYRHTIYCGVLLTLIQSMIILGINLFSDAGSRGLIIGWLFSALIMILFGLVTMLKSIREVDKALELRRRTDPKVCDVIFAKEEKEEESLKKIKYRKKSKRLAKYMMCFACLLIFDITLGIKPTPGEMDLLHLVYDLILKIMLMIMIFQRRVIRESRNYELDVQDFYEPFDLTFKSGSRELHTYYKLEEMVAEKNQKMGIKEEKKLKNLTVPVTSSNNGYSRFTSFQDDESVPNTPLEGDIREEQEYTAPLPPVRPPKEVSSMKDAPRQFTLPSLEGAAIPEDVHISVGTASEIPESSNMAQVPAKRVEVNMVQVRAKRREADGSEKARMRDVYIKPVRNPSDEVIIEPDELKASVRDSSVEDPSVEIVNHQSPSEL